MAQALPGQAANALSCRHSLCGSHNERRSLTAPRRNKVGRRVVSASSEASGWKSTNGIGGAPCVDWIGTTEHHKRPPEIFYSKPGERFLLQAGECMQLHELPAGTRVIYAGLAKDGENDAGKMRALVAHALDHPVGQPPLRERLRQLKSTIASPKILFAFDDVSVPLPPMRRPDLRQLIMEEAEQLCMEEGITDVRFVCSIALHRYIRADEFEHICGPKLFNKYYPERMTNYNAVDDYDSVVIGTTRHGELVEVNKHFAESDLLIYANVNYVSMDGGYKSYATGLVHYRCLLHNHDSKTLRKTRSLYDPTNSALHKSFYRIGRIMQKHTDVFHVETVIDDRLFPFYASFVMENPRNMSLIDKLFMYGTVYSLPLLPVWLRSKILWATRGPMGLLKVTAGETQAVHEQTLATIFETKVLDVQGQADILILAPSCLGPYTKDCLLNPLLVNTYSLGYYYNMYVDGVPLLKDGGCVVVVCDMHYEWTSPAHDTYRELFERVLSVAPGLDEFEAYQEEFVRNDKLNDIYRNGQGPAAVHSFYMYTWAAHGMDKVGKVIVVGASDKRGPEVLRWDTADSVIDAVKRAKEFLGNSDASVTFMQVPPVGYLRVHRDDAGGGEEGKEKLEEGRDNSMADVVNAA